MATKFQNNDYPSDGSIPAYSSADGNLAVEILGANGRRVRLVNVDCNTTYGPSDNMTMGHSATYNGSVSIQDYIANGETDGGPVMVDADPFYLRIGGAPSPATGKFYGELQIETGIDTGEYVDMEVSGVDFSSMLTGAFSEYQLVADEPPAPACFWENLVRVSQDCVSGPGVARAQVMMPAVGYSWSDVVWDGAELYTPPAQPLTYPSPQDMPFFVTGTGATTLTKARASNTASSSGFSGGRLNVDANLSFGGGGGQNMALTTSTTYAYTTGSGPRTRQVYAEFETAGAYSLPAGFTRDVSEWIYGEDSLFEARSENCKFLTGACSVISPGMATTATVYLNFTGFSGVTIPLIVNGPVAFDHTYSIGSGGPTNSAGSATIDAAGSPFTDYISVTTISGANVTNPTSLAFNLTGLKRRGYPLRKIVAYLENVVEYVGVTAGDDPYEIPAGPGTPLDQKMAIIDNHGVDYSVQAGYPLDATAYVGDLVDADDPGTVICKMIVWRDPSG